MKVAYEPYPNEALWPVKASAGRMAVVSYDASDWLMRKDGTWAPRRFSYLEDDGGDSVQYMVVLAHNSSARLYAESVHVQVPDGAHAGPTTTDLLRVRNVKTLVRELESVLVMSGPRGGDAESPTSGSKETQPPPTRTLGLARVAGLFRKPRTSVTDDLLRKVAAIYSANEPTGAPVKAVQDAFNCGESTAFRYVSAARGRGFLPPRDEEQ
jgi:hypothetical protein